MGGRGDVAETDRASHRKPASRNRARVLPTACLRLPSLFTLVDPNLASVDDPLLRSVNHVYQLSDYSIILLIKISGFSL